jgi:hypothetical protein
MTTLPLRSRFLSALALAGLSWGLARHASAGPDRPPSVPVQAGAASFALEPQAGPPGTPVTLTGSGLAGTVQVRFSPDLEAAFTVVGDSTVTTTVPQGARTGPVQVTTAAGVLASPQPFQVDGP